MVKGIVSNRSAGLRHSAIVERLRVREEWSSLKGTENGKESPARIKKKQTRIFKNNVYNIKTHNKTPSHKMANYDEQSRSNKENAQPRSSSDVLRGIVALVEVGTETRALPLRAALMALGATVVSDWSPLVTHLIWSQGGSRDTRARARALACKVVSPLWVEACAASARRISEKVFPSTARNSDLPSPATLCRLLKRAEKENWLIAEIQSDSEDDDKQIRLRISSETDENTTKDSPDVNNCVNTAPRRALPISISPPPANLKSRRKLFTARPDEEDDSDTENTVTVVTKTVPRPETNSTRAQTATNRPKMTTNAPNRVERVPERQRKLKNYNLTQEQQRNMENAKRMAKRLAANPGTNQKVEGTQTQRKRISSAPKIVLSGMPKSQYQAVFSAIQTLKGKIQKQVNHRTTHVLLGSCKADQKSRNNEPKTQVIHKNKSPQKNKDKSPNETPVKPFSICNQCNSPEGIVMKMFECDNVEVVDHCSNPMSTCGKDVTVICSTVNRNSKDNVNSDEVVICDVDKNQNISDLCEGITNDKRLRTLKTLLGAARGCRVLHAQWALDSLKQKKWIPHVGYEVTHLLKVAQKALVERSAIDKMNLEYGYNVFRGMRVSVTETAHQRDAAIQLLLLCGAEIVNEADISGDTRNNQYTKTSKVNETTQHGGRTQNGATDNCDIIVIGKGDREVSSKWVFDSVAAGRPRTTRRYINENIIIIS